MSRAQRVCAYCGEIIDPLADRYAPNDCGGYYHFACIPEGNVPVRQDLVNHLKQKIAADPEAYANPAALAAALKSPRLAEDLTAPHTLREALIWMEGEHKAAVLSRDRYDDRGESEFYSGMARAFRECLQVLRKVRRSNDA